MIYAKAIGGYPSQGEQRKAMPVEATNRVRQESSVRIERNFHRKNSPQTITSSKQGAFLPHAILKPDMYKRILLKISGEALAAGKGFGIDAVFIHKVAAEIAAVHALGCEIGIVVGGGNFFRGVAQQAIDMDRVAADHMGMLSTVINAIALQDAIEKLGLFCRVMSAIEMHEVAEPYIRRRAMRHLEKGRIVIFAAGTGNPFFSTDAAASLRAMEIKADILLKATSVDGIYTA